MRLLGVWRRTECGWEHSVTPLRWPEPLVRGSATLLVVPRKLLWRVVPSYEAMLQLQSWWRSLAWMGAGKRPCRYKTMTKVTAIIHPCCRNFENLGRRQCISPHTIVSYNKNIQFFTSGYSRRQQVLWKPIIKKQIFIWNPIILWCLRDWTTNREETHSKQSVDWIFQSSGVISSFSVEL